MVEVKGAFSGYSTDNIDLAKKFYQNIIGLGVKEAMGGLELDFPGGQQVFIYPKNEHQPATYTVLNLVVGDINAAVDELVAKGVVFEHYDTMPAAQDERGVLRGKDTGMGPNIAWFKDPGGNIVALVEQ
jgi:predicted enzyme related to lactoylglutathione lyase